MNRSILLAYGIIMEKLVRKISKALKESVRSRIDKIAVARTDATPIGLRRISLYKRCSMYESQYAALPKPLPAFAGGLVVVIPPERADEYLHILGSDEGVSAVIGLEGAYNAANIARLDAFRVECAARGWKPLRKLVKDNCGNQHWEGHYYIHLKGDGQGTVSEGCEQLANNANEYAPPDACSAIVIQMSYWMLRSKDARTLLNDESQYESLLAEIESECGYLLRPEMYPCNPIGPDGYLQCWSEKTIHAADFLQRDGVFCIEKCHVDSVAEGCIRVVDSKIETTNRVYGHMWGFRWANLAQSNDSIPNTRERLGLNLKAENERLRAENAELRARIGTTSS